MLKPKQISLLEEYHANRLSSEDQREVEQNLLNDPQTKAEAEAYFDLLDGFDALELEHFEGQLQHWEAKHQKVEVVSKETATKSIQKSFFRKYRLAVAAVIIVMLLPLGYLLVQNASEQQLFADHFSHYEDYTFTKTRAITPNEELSLAEREKVAQKVMLDRGIAAYNRKDYKTTVESLSNYLGMTTETQNREEIKLYLSIAQIVTGQTTGAEQHLLDLTKNASSANMKEAADWYLGLNYLKMEKVKKAKKTLRKIARNNKHRYQDKASKLLPELDKYTK